MAANRDRIMNSINALKYGPDDPRVRVCLTLIEEAIHDLYDRIEELEKRLGDT